MRKRHTWKAARYDDTWWKLVKSTGSTYWVKLSRTDYGTDAMIVYTGANRRPASLKVADKLRHHFRHAIERATA